MSLNEKIKKTSNYNQYYFAQTMGFLPKSYDMVRDHKTIREMNVNRQLQN